MAFLDFKEHGVNIYAEQYADTLNGLRTSIRNGVISLHDNVPCYVAHTIQDLLGQ